MLVEHTMFSRGFDVHSVFLLGCKAYSLFVGIVPQVLLRAYLVPVFYMAGSTKLDHIDAVIQQFGEGYGFPFPALMAYMAALTEYCGAIMLALGFGVRLICIPLAITMVVAALSVHIDHGWLAIASGSDPEVAERLRAANGILRENAVNFNWLVEKGRFVILNNGIQFAATYFIMCLALIGLGAGRYLSVDHYVMPIICRKVKSIFNIECGA